jgi:glycosyltransferase involved in cell wall biosynthesis
MRVCYIYPDEYPWDVRAEKITTSLAANGMDVHILSGNTTGAARYEVAGDNLRYHRLPAWWGRATRKWLNFPAFFSPIWIRAAVSLIRRESIELLIVRDLPLGPMAWIAGRITGARVVMDMAENYPAMIHDTWVFRGPRPTDYLLRNPALLRAMESWLLPRLDGVMVVSRASQERVLTLTKNRLPVWIVGNTPRLEEAARVVSHPAADAIKARGALSLIYVGGLDSKRGVEVVIKALPKLAAELRDVLFIVAGRGTGEPVLHATAKELGVNDHVMFLGWVDPAAVPTLIAAADIGIVPHYATEHTNTTIPNKIYDYMVQGKPVIVSTAKNLQDIVEQTHCGRVFRDRDPEDLARAVLSLENPQVRSELGRAGQVAVETEFNWGCDEQVLVEAVRSLAR